MSVPSDTIYLLTISSGGRTTDDGNLYITNPNTDHDEFDLSMSIKDAKVFYSRQDAWNFREDIDRREWQITPMSALNVFKRKLKSK